MFLGAPVPFWLVFLGVIAAVLAFDLGYVSRRYKVLSLRQSVSLTVFYTALALSFGAGVWMFMGANEAQLFLTAFILEQSLSIDNVFVMSVIFSFFAIPREFQHRVLFWGIIVAMVLRGVFIGAGSAMVEHFEGLLFVFAAFLIVMGVRMALAHDDEPDISKNAVVSFMTRRLRVTKDIEGERFFLPRPDSAGVLRSHATPLFLAFMTINVADVVFAVDSVPAVLSLTNDPFIVYTSNIFAILGLRSLYFVIAAMIDRFSYLKYALAFLLVFIGGTIFWKAFVGDIPASVTLGVTISALALSIVASLMRRETTS